MTPTLQSAFHPSASLSGRSNDLWIIVSAYNEGARLAHTLDLVCGLYPNVVVIDDASEDDTNRIALQYPVWVVRHVVNLGAGAALQTGLIFAMERGATVMVSFDGDGQHCVEDIERLIEPIRAGKVDVALGSRFLGQSIGMPWTRWLVLKLGVLFTWAYSRVRVTDTHNGLRAFSRRAAQQLRITQNRMAHGSQVIDQIRERGLRFGEVPVTIRYTEETLAKGQSSWNALRIVAQLFLGRIVQ